MTFQHSHAHDDGTPTPGAHPNGYMLGPDEGLPIWFAGGLIAFRAKAADTRGMMSFFNVEAPYGWQAPVHKHAGEGEAFYGIEGEVEVFVNDTVHLMKPGCFVWIPPDTPHSLFVRTPRAKGFCVVTPAGFEKFFEDLGETATIPSMPTHETRMPSVEELTEGGAKYGWQFVEPEPRRLDDHR